MSVADRLLLQPANRATLGADITRAILAVERTGSMESKPGLTVTVDDPRSALIESKLLTRPSLRDIGTPAANTLRPIDLLLDGVWYRLQQAKRTGQTVVLTLDHRGAVFMAEHDTAMSASRGQVTRAQFIRRQVFEAGRRRSAGYKLAFWAPEVGRAMPQAKMTEQVSSRAEPDRDPSSIVERANRLKGVKVRGKELDAGQRRNAATMIVQCEQDNASPKATLACCMACIIEPGGYQGSGPFDNPLGGDASSVGILQLLALHLGGSTSTSGGRRDVALVVHLFLTKGFYGKGGAIEIARRNPGMSAGIVAQNVQGSAFPARYDQVAADARRVIAALGGTTGASTTATGGSYVKPFRFRRERGVNAWASTEALATEVGRRRFVTIPARGSDVFVYASDEDLLKLRPQARLSLDAPYIVSRAYDLDYGKTIRSVQLQVLGDPFDADFAWGLPVILGDDPLVDGTWLVWDVRETDGSPVIDLELRQPQPFKPEPASDTVSRADTSDSSPDAAKLSGTASGKVLARGKSISDRNYPYVWGGGHARVGVPDGGTGRDPGTGYDCSGVTGACVYSAGMWPSSWGRSVPGSGTFASSWGEPGEGERITVWANAGHVFIEVKIPGQRVRWIDTSRQAGGPSGPHVRFGNRSTAGFTARRWPGV